MAHKATPPYGRNDLKTRLRISQENITGSTTPLQGERRRVCWDGQLQLQGRQPHLGEALAGEAVGLVEVEEELEQF